MSSAIIPLFASVIIYEATVNKKGLSFFLDFFYLGAGHTLGSKVECSKFH